MLQTQESLFNSQIVELENRIRDTQHQCEELKKSQAGSLSECQDWKARAEREASFAE